MKIKRVIHIGVMAHNVTQVKALYQGLLELPIGHEELYEGSVDICFLPVGDSSIEIFADNPNSGKGIVAEMIREQGGEGIHHIAFEVDDIEDAVKELKAKNVPIRDGDPTPGASGTMIAFLDPSITNGVLIELVQDKS